MSAKPPLGDLELEHDGAGIGRGDALDHVVLAAHRRGAVGIEQAAEGGDDVVGRHLLAVVEFHATAQAERPALEIVTVGPALGEIGLDHEVLAHARQPVEGEVRVDVFVACRDHHRVERVERRADADAQRLAGGMSRPNDGGRRQ